MKNSKFQQRFKNMDYLIKMKLNELLKQRHKKEIGKSPTTINEVYGIIYRIYCIPENKSYVGQTMSHGYVNDSLSRKGIITRIRSHYNDKSLDQNINKPLYIALSTFNTDQFEVFEEEKIFGKELALINIKEGEYMKKYNSLDPNGYNTEEVGKIYSQLLKDLSKFYNFEIEKYEYVDSTRERRRKDICIGPFFNLKRKQINKEKIIELLKTVDIDHLYLTNSNGLRIIARLKNENTNIRVYFKGDADCCLEFAQKISINIVISPSFYKETYKYQLKLDKVLDDKESITVITGKEYNNSSRDHKTYLIIVYGNKKERHQQLHRISFGGKTIDIKESYKNALDFINKIKEKMPVIEYKINNPII
jgi:hypothetical protein